MGATTKYLRYALMAEVFRYPTEGFGDRMRSVDAMLATHYPETVHVFERFLDWATTTPLHDMEEVYARTFHVQAICYLDLGFVLFGEDYKRGEFLVNMKREQAMADNDCGCELPDNLVNVLTLLPLLKDSAFRDELAGRIMIPSLRRMLQEFSDTRTVLREKMLKRKHNAILLADRTDGNIYKNALEALLVMLTADHVDLGMLDARPQGDPLHAAAPMGCGTCAEPHHSTPIPTKP